MTFSPLVMSFPAEGVELGFRNHIEDVRTFLDSRHPDHYTVFNLSPKSYRSARFHNRVSDFCWHDDVLVYSNNIPVINIIGTNFCMVYTV